MESPNNNELALLLKAAESDAEGVVIQLYKEIVALRSVQEAVLRYAANTHPQSRLVWSAEMVRRAMEIEKEGRDGSYT